MIPLRKNLNCIAINLKKLLQGKYHYRDYIKVVSNSKTFCFPINLKANKGHAVVQH